MEIELEAMWEPDPIVVTFCADDDGMGASLGVKKWNGKPGQFTYEWIGSYLTKDDLVELARMVGKAIELMPDSVDAVAGVSDSDTKP